MSMYDCNEEDPVMSFSDQSNFQPDNGKWTRKNGNLIHTRQHWLSYIYFETNYLPETDMEIDLYETDVQRFYTNILTFKNHTNTSMIYKNIRRKAKN